MKQIDKLIINSPYEKPSKYWQYDRNKRDFELKNGRRPAGFVIATPDSQSFDDPGIFIEIDLVNKIRKRVDRWREEGYPGVTSVTKRLLDYWKIQEDREVNFFYCQLEAIETLIWLIEANESDKVGIDIPLDGGYFRRICSKMATGSGKTVVMAMLIAWQVLNKSTYKKDKRFSDTFLIVTPGLTVKSRLSVLFPDQVNNYYSEFDIIPVDLIPILRNANIVIENWHKLSWESEEDIEKKKSVDKRGPLSDSAYTKNIFGNFYKTKNIIVINDEAHHAWRIQKELKVKREFEEQINEATVWVNGLDRIHKVMGIMNCYDFSATPFSPTGKQTYEENLFNWVVSDFGLNDAIESGLVKTPRVVIRDDGKIDLNHYKSRLYHIYNDEEVKEDISRKAEETEPLPDLIINAYYLLGIDWLDTKKNWESSGHKIPPAMITVTNTTYTAARIKYSFDHNEIQIKELCNKEKTVQIDSTVLSQVESLDEEMSIGEDNKKLTQIELAELLRRKVTSVGKVGEPGEQLQNIISVNMLSEGWDAKNVTHIMGLRAFTSQLLCEQVVGRGLRRISYEVDEDGLFEPEYVNIFGVPFTFLPHEGGEGAPPRIPKAKTQIEPDPEKIEHEINWPNVSRIEHIFKNKIDFDIVKVSNFEIDPYENITDAYLAAIIGGKPNEKIDLTNINLRELVEQYRTQTVVFEMAKRIFNKEKERWNNNVELLSELINIVNSFLTSNKVKIINNPHPGNNDYIRIMTLLNMNKIINHIWKEVKLQNTKEIELVFDPLNPIKSTSDMKTWYTSKPCERASKTHINFAVFDSSWEASEAFTLNNCDLVESWVRNDHLGFDIYYLYGGIVRRYWPDFIVRLKNREYLIIETKGVDTKRDEVKRDFMDEWVKAVNASGDFGKWNWLVSFHPNDLISKIEEIYNKKNSE